jgi:hypothetical protein
VGRGLPEASTAAGKKVGSRERKRGKYPLVVALVLLEEGCEKYANSVTGGYGVCVGKARRASKK